jgi:DNA-binding PadR family transcriptional regulator
MHESGNAAAIQAHIPMKPVWHQVLLSIATGDEHGYAIRESVEARTDGAMRLWPATLYGTLQRMTEAGLLDERPAPDDPRGKRLFSLTGSGRAVLEAETRRLETLVNITRTESVLAGRDR